MNQNTATAHKTEGQSNQDAFANIVGEEVKGYSEMKGDIPRTKVAIVVGSKLHVFQYTQVGRNLNYTELPASEAKALVKTAPADIQLLVKELKTSVAKDMGKVLKGIDKKVKAAKAPKVKKEKAVKVAKAVKVKKEKAVKVKKEKAVKIAREPKGKTVTDAFLLDREIYLNDHHSFGDGIAIALHPIYNNGKFVFATLFAYTYSGRKTAVHLNDKGKTKVSRIRFGARQTPADWAESVWPLAEVAVARLMDEPETHRGGKAKIKIHEGRVLAAKGPVEDVLDMLNKAGK